MNPSAEDGVTGGERVCPGLLIPALISMKSSLVHMAGSRSARAAREGGSVSLGEQDWGRKANVSRVWPCLVLCFESCV